MAKKIVIDAGHGGTDPGASANGLLEKEYTLLISEYMEERLKAMGLEVSMTRTEDITLNPSDRTKKVKEFYGNGDNVLVISNHINAGGVNFTQR